MALYCSLSRFNPVKNEAVCSLILHFSVKHYNFINNPDLNELRGTCQQGIWIIYANTFMQTKCKFSIHIKILDTVCYALPVAVETPK